MTKKRETEKHNLYFNLNIEEKDLILQNSK